MCDIAHFYFGGAESRVELESQVYEACMFPLHYSANFIWSK